MPTRPIGYCAAPGCNARVNGRCAKHRRKQAGPNADFYQSKQWKALSRQVRREEPFCRMGCGRPTVQADHIVAITDGGAPLARENVQGLCLWDHQRKTKADTARRRAARA